VVPRTRAAAFALLAALAFLAMSGPSLAAAELEPSFRLPIAGRAAAGPVVAAGIKPEAAWILSEDQSLYLLSDSGALIAHINFPKRPLPFLAVDPAGRALVVLVPAGGGPASLVAYSRLGQEVWQAQLDAFADPTSRQASPTIAFGADERVFIGMGKSLLCFAQNGRRLWSLDLPAAIVLGPSVDGAGRPILGLADGSLLVAGPMGGIEARASLGGLSALGPFARASWRGGEGAAGDLPLLAAGLRDGRILLLGRKAEVLATVEGAVPVSAFASDGASLYALRSDGRLSGLSRTGEAWWSAETRVQRGSLSLYADRLVATGQGRAVSISLWGSLFKEASFTNSTGPCVLSPTGMLYSPGADWVIGAYRFEKVLGPRIEPLPPPYGDDQALLDQYLLIDPTMGDTSGRAALLAELAAGIDSGSLGEDEGRVGALAGALALGGFEGSWPAHEARFRADPWARVQALRLLGRLGSPARISLLLKVFRDGAADPLVRASACDAIAAIGRDPLGEAGAAFLEAATPGQPRLQPEVAMALVAAIEAISLRGGPPPGVEAVRALIALSAAPNSPDVRSAAGKALGRLAGTLGP
jgi:hypothetical protein